MSRKSTPVRSRRLMVETLESRSMLAGNVTATVTDGVLNVSGDGDLIIHQLRQASSSPWPGVKLELIGKNLSNQQTTNINGEASVVLSGIKSGVNIFGGDIRLLASNSTTYRGSVPIGDYGGERTVALPGNVTIDTAFARLYIRNFTKVTVNGTGQSDDILISGSQLSKLDVNADVGATAASDRVRLLNVRAKGAVNIDMGSNGADGSPDTLEITSKWGAVFDGAVNIVTDTWANVTASGTTRFAERDYSLIFNGPVSYDGGQGKDAFALEEVESNGSFTVALGSGDDIISFKKAHASGVTLDGGEGTDIFAKDSESDLGEETVTNFETIEVID